MIEQIIFILMIVVALFIVIERNIKYIIIALAVFSLLAAFTYLLFHAPDVAIAEAVIGSALSTILYIVALKKYRTFYIYLTYGENSTKSDVQMKREVRDVLSPIMLYCTAQELEVQLVFINEEPDKIIQDHICDMIIYSRNDTITIYGYKGEYHIDNIREKLNRNLKTVRVAFALMEWEDLNNDTI